MKILNVLRWIVFFITLSISMFIFIFYMIFKLDANEYYVLNNLTKEQSEEIKEVIGFSEFEKITINSFKHKYEWGNDIYRNFTFDITVSNEVYEVFVEFIEMQMGGMNPAEKPCAVILEDNVLQEENSHKMQIVYTVWDDNGILGYVIREGQRHYASEVWVLIPQFLLLLLVNSLIVLPYKKKIFRRTK